VDIRVLTADANSPATPADRFRYVRHHHAHRRSLQPPANKGATRAPLALPGSQTNFRAVAALDFSGPDEWEDSLTAAFSSGQLPSPGGGERRTGSPADLAMLWARPEILAHPGRQYPLAADEDAAGAGQAWEALFASLGGVGRPDAGLEGLVIQESF
jgi:hypothetical protein